jgi:hypothetical protein
MTTAQTDDWRLDALIADCETLLDLVGQLQDGTAKTQAKARRQLDRAVHDLAVSLARVQSLLTTEPPIEKPDVSGQNMTR